MRTRTQLLMIFFVVISFISLVVEVPRAYSQQPQPSICLPATGVVLDYYDRVVSDSWIRQNLFVISFRYVSEHQNYRLVLRNGWITLRSNVTYRLVPIVHGISEKTITFLLEDTAWGTMYHIDYSELDSLLYTDGFPVCLLFEVPIFMGFSVRPDTLLNQRYHINVRYNTIYEFNYTIDSNTLMFYYDDGFSKFRLTYRITEFMFRTNKSSWFYFRIYPETLLSLRILTIGTGHYYDQSEQHLSRYDIVLTAMQWNSTHSLLTIDRCDFHVMCTRLYTDVISSSPYVDLDVFLDDTLKLKINFTTIRNVDLGIVMPERFFTVVTYIPKTDNENWYGVGWIRNSWFVNDVERFISTYIDISPSKFSNTTVRFYFLFTSELSSTLIYEQNDQVRTRRLFLKFLDPQTKTLLPITSIDVIHDRVILNLYRNTTTTVECFRFTTRLSVSNNVFTIRNICYTSTSILETIYTLNIEYDTYMTGFIEVFVFSNTKLWRYVLSYADMSSITINRTQILSVDLSQHIDESYEYFSNIQIPAWYDLPGWFRLLADLFVNFFRVVFSFLSIFISSLAYSIPWILRLFVTLYFFINVTFLLYNPALAIQFNIEIYRLIIELIDKIRDAVQQLAQSIASLIEALNPL
ncbi:MAG: hypothetical protein QXX12_03045 [Nanopusillaceae archaeon]